jgi:hypothetical protein
MFSSLSRAREIRRFNRKRKRIFRFFRLFSRARLDLTIIRLRALNETVRQAEPRADVLQQFAFFAADV